MVNYFKFLPAEVTEKKVVKGDFPFSPFLFWDTPVCNIDTEKHKNYIIERVITRGWLQDFYYLLQLYSQDEITVAVKKSKVLDPKTVHFCSYYFNIPLKELHASPYYT